VDTAAVGKKRWKIVFWTWKGRRGVIGQLDAESAWRLCWHWRKHNLPAEFSPQNESSSTRTAIRVDHLDMLRGLAAGLVLTGHLRSYVFTSFASTSDSGLQAKLFYGITGLGHQAVIIFFAMSGFLVGGKALEDMLSGGWSWPRYLLRRICRLWIVIIPALVATFVLDHIGMRWAGGAVYDATLYDVYSSWPRLSHLPNYQLITFLGNIAFMQTIWVPAFGTDGPIWSLANEFWYYIVFPLAASLFLVSYQVRKRLLATAVLFLTILLLPWWLLQPGLIWVAGAWAAWLTRRKFMRPVLRHNAVRLCGFAVATIALALTKSDMGISDLVLGLAIAACLPVLAMLPRLGRCYQLLARRAADLSYSLYLTHFPFLTLVISVGLAPYRFEFGATGMLVYLLLLVGAIAWASVFWWSFERNTDRVFYYLSARLQLQTPGAFRMGSAPLRP
jgi:peptidoglycan/LPS O-acetylase OafA/YrhL